MTDQETTDLIARLQPIAKRFRAALEILKRDWEPLVKNADDRPQGIGGFAVFKRFPCGCCDNATRFLVRYLTEAGFSEVGCVHGYDKDNVSRRHTWVRVGSVHIDLTADQFEDISPCPDPVIVVIDLKFHRRFDLLGEENCSQCWSVWKSKPEVLPAAEWLYATVKRLVDDE